MMAPTLTGISCLDIFTHLNVDFRNSSLLLGLIQELDVIQ